MFFVFPSNLIILEFHATMVMIKLLSVNAMCVHICGLSEVLSKCWNTETMNNL